MYKFLSNKGHSIQKCGCFIEPNTNLLVVYQKEDNEEVPRQIKLTAEQIKGIKSLFFRGSFYTLSKPSNSFSLKDGIVTMYCKDENQLIELSVSDMPNIYQYFERHKDRIERFDYDFKK